MRIKFICSLALMLVFLAGTLPAWAREALDAKEVTVEEVAKLLKEKPENLIILDVRTPVEFRKGHIPGARNIDFLGGRFDVDVANLPKESDILVYCASGKLSPGAVEELNQAGFKNVLHMDKGLEGWTRARLPLEK